jgi:hypothetical protein
MNPAINPAIDPAINPHDNYPATIDDNRQQPAITDRRAVDLIPP